MDGDFKEDKYGNKLTDKIECSEARGIGYSKSNTLKAIFISPFFMSNGFVRNKK